MARTRRRSRSSPRGKAARKPRKASNARKPRPARGPWRRRLLAGLAALLLVVVGCPPLQVASLRITRPPTTGTRVQRAVQAMGHGELPGQRHDWVPLDQVSDELVQAVLVSEDQRFWVHDGFDLDQVEAALAERQAGGQLRGASTLTMQCARTVFLWQGRSWSRKGLEALYTLWMEALLPKERILEVYLNEVEWGPQVFGAQAGASHHFGVQATAVDRETACMLATVLPDPRHRDPTRPTDGMQAKAAWICSQAEFPLPRPIDP